MGTSLTVHPFASLTQLVPDGCPRVLVNMDKAGDIGTRADDVLLLGKTDEVVRELCEALGEDWVEELDAMWKETEKYAHKPDEAEEQAAEVKKDTKVTESDELAQAKALHDEVDKLTQEVERALQIGHVPSHDDTESESEPEELVEEVKPALETTTPESAESGKDVAPPAAATPTKDSDVIGKEKSETSNDQETKPAEGKL